MSLQAVVVTPIPAEMMRVAQAIFCKDNRYMQMRDEFGGFYQDRQFAALYATQGQTTMIYTHVRNRGGRGVRCPLDE